MVEEAWEREIESLPVFIASQFRPGHVLTDDDVKAIHALVSELDAKEDGEVAAFQQGRENAFREIGGEELLIAVKMKDEERLARMVRAHMDKIFPKHQRTRQ